MNLTVGIDLGSTYTKAVVVAPEGAILGKVEFPSGYHFGRASERALEAVLDAGGIPRDWVDYIAVTGYGRYMASFRDVAVTELTCHAWALSRFFPGVRTVLDIGGQMVKAIRLDGRGRIKAFRLNDKCAAGSGAFLENTVRYLGYQTPDIARLAGAATSPATISSVCAVFAESEVINHLTAGRSAEDVCAGALIALAERAGQVFKRVRPEAEYALSGGLTRIPQMREALEAVVGGAFHVAPDDLGVYAGAIGAATLAQGRIRKLAARAIP